MPEEHEYVQCLRDPRTEHSNRFITVRTISGTLRFDNSVCPPDKDHIKTEENKFVKYSSCDRIKPDFFQ